MATWKSNNTSCVKFGHLWILTTADNFRSCERIGCGTVERKVDGVWITANVRQEKKKKQENSKYKPESLF